MKNEGNKQPVISIITVVYNDRENLAKTIESVGRLTYTDYEFIVWDGASADGTIETIKKNEMYITAWFSEPDEGIYDAMNKAVKKAKGKWIYFLNAGDVLFDILHLLIPFMHHDNNVIYGDSYWPHTHQLYNGRYNRYKILTGNICHQSILYPRSVFEKYQFNTAYKVKADYHLNLCLYADEAYRFVYAPVLICYFNDREGFSKRNADDRFEQDLKHIVYHHYSLFHYFFFRLFKCLLPVYGFAKRKLTTGKKY